VILPSRHPFCEPDVVARRPIRLAERSDRRRDDHRRRSDRGSLTLWSLAICIALLAFGFVTVDFWRAISGWRRLAAAADAAAAAGASGIDEAHYRSTGELTLDPARAERLARRTLEAQLDDADITGFERIEVDGDQITVVLDGQVDLVLPQLVGHDDIDMSVTATADPRVVE
jgi:Flp pilus assembly protein TadG